MIRVLASVALLGITLAPLAEAQVSCGEVRRIIAESRTDFEDITGARIEDDYYRSTYFIGGSKECYVEVDIAAVYSCLFVHERPDSAFSAYRYRLGEVRNCLSSWKQTILKEQSPLSGDGFRDLEGVWFAGSGDYDGMEWLVSVEQHIQNGDAHYHVRVEFSYF